MLNIPRHQKNKNQSKLKKKLLRIVRISVITVDMHKKKMECIDLHVFRRVWSWYVETNGRVEALRVWVLYVDPEWLLSSCAVTDGDGRVGPACPCRVCASSWWFGCSVSVFVCVSVGVVVWLSASLPPPPHSRPAESPSLRAAVRSPPDGRSRRSSSHHGWGWRER